MMQKLSITLKISQGNCEHRELKFRVCIDPVFFPVCNIKGAPLPFSKGWAKMVPLVQLFCLNAEAVACSSVSLV